MKRLFILLVITLLSVTAFGQDIFNEPSVITRANPNNFETLLDNHYGFIANGTYYILAYPVEYERDVVGKIPRISRDLRLYSWTDGKWEIASKQIISTDNRLIIDNKSYHDKIVKKDYYGFSKIERFNDTIVMLITYQYKIEDHAPYSRTSEITKTYLYNTINIFVPKDNGKYEVYVFAPAEPTDKKTVVPLWRIKGDSCITKSGDNFSFTFDFGKLTFNIAK